MRYLSGMLLCLFSASFAEIAIAEEVWQVTTMCWDAMSRKDWDAVISQADRAVKTWGGPGKNDEW